MDPDCRFAYETNNSARFLEQDVRSLSGHDLEGLFADGGVRLLAGCAPCQPFSTYSRTARRSRRHEMWDLLSEFGRLVRELQPDLVTMENVPQVVQCPVFRGFLDDLTGYWVSYQVVECSHYGIPQTRKRLVLLASKLGPIELAASTGWGTTQATVHAAISALPRLQAGETDSSDSLHSACRLSEINLQRIRASRPGGTWRDWDASLIAACHRRGSGSTYPSVYGRMAWDGPAPTITTQCFGYGNGRFGHPEQDRAITLREAAILQTFPSHYRFLRDGEAVRFNVMGRLIGNAVPVRLGQVIATSLVQHVAGLQPTEARHRRSSLFPCD
jgi:DNA (cytosine-5)-methyltransferase 1